MTTLILKRAAALTFLLAILLAACGSRYGRSDQASSQLAFGVDMARRGLWSEALFRFHQAAQLEPQNPRVLNNLGVAYEATGEYEKALSYYQQALKIEPGNKELKANYGRFVEFYQAYKGKEGKDKGTGESTPGAPAAVPGSPGQAPPAPPPAQPEPAPEETPPSAL
jgi:tetratricopeptide (TPR) repeat protein